MAGTQTATRTQPADTVTLTRLFVFFIPLGLSASLVTISHVIINSTLAQAARPELVISSYAIAMSLMGITERPAVLLRQTCSALVRDRVSFRAMRTIALLVFGSILAAGSIVAYTPVGTGVFRYFFGVDADEVDSVIGVYRILMFVSIFSGLRCLYHGIIIYNKRTAMLTIGMGIRLLGMYELSQYFLRTDRVTSGNVGAIIFFVGMFIECMIAIWSGRSLLRKAIPEKEPDHPVTRPRQIYAFYRPLLLSSFIAIIASPAINAALGKTPGAEMSIAAFAIAASLMQLVISFFSYIHQVVLNFYPHHPQRVARFLLLLAPFPAAMLGILSFTPVGPWFLSHVMGVNQSLMAASLSTLTMFLPMTLLFPWLDFGNGLLMLKGQTKVMFWSQSANVAATIITLLAAISAAPAWNGAIGAMSQSIGTAFEAAVVARVLYTLSRGADAAGTSSVG